MSSTGIQLTKGTQEVIRRGKLAELWRRFKKDKFAVIGGVILLVVILCAIFAPLITHYDPNETQLEQRLLPPGTEGHFLGTDEVGRDMFTRLVYGARVSVMIGFVAVAIALFFGILVGLFAGYYGGWIDTILMRCIDVLMAFPYVLLAISIIAALGPGLLQAMVAISIVGIPYYARIVRGTVLSLRNKEFIEAEKALGASNMRIIFKHILPNTMAPIIVAATLDVGWMIIAAAGLSFLGLGAQPPTAEWGVMLSEGRKFLRVAPYVSLLPGVCIFLVVLSLNLLGDGLRDALDPRLKQ
ncbi:nickel transporter permease [Desulfotomaculum sp. 1211_IL3151]|uniref:nickel transporter permease n=1 Tax=Desulfotomaculum sp. 1211_IL3151 TaxID=3084055 RepID=UPI002FDA5DA7